MADWLEDWIKRIFYIAANGVDMEKLLGNYGNATYRRTDVRTSRHLFLTFFSLLADEK